MLRSLKRWAETRSGLATTEGQPGLRLALLLRRQRVVSAPDKGLQNQQDQHAAAGNHLPQKCPIECDGQTGTEYAGIR